MSYLQSLRWARLPRMLRPVPPRKEFRAGSPDSRAVKRGPLPPVVEWGLGAPRFLALVGQVEPHWETSGPMRGA
ncbi:hypothetical protein DB31_7689 [Hyalangium minutum]|uniref:Uncharacterized protein n=1 Tax=Hyalangium minutum TaxID=394096 RepID=A0A085WL89_9BACT|nr:hypothetical protein DB31_7689 [Hyalangium minutum]